MRILSILLIFISIGCECQIQAVIGTAPKGTESPQFSALFYGPSSQFATSTARVPEAETIDGGGANRAFSIACWIRPNNFSAADQKIFTVSDATKEQYILRIFGQAEGTNSHNLQFRIFGTGASTAINILSSVELKRNRDYHIVITYSGGTTASGLNIYINGSVDGSASKTNSGTFASGYTASTLRLLFGKSLFSPAEHFSGNLGHWACYDKELSGAEVTTLYGDGTPRDYEQDAIFGSNGLLYFPLNVDFVSSDDNVTLTETGASITEDGFDVDNERLSFMNNDVSNTRYNAFGGFTILSGTTYRYYTRRGTSHIASGVIAKYDVNPTTEVVSAVTTDLITNALDLRSGNGGVIGSKVFVFSATFDGAEQVEALRFESTDGLTGLTFDSGTAMTISGDVTGFNFYGRIIPGFSAGHYFMPFYEHASGTWRVFLFKTEDSGTTWSEKIQVFEGANDLGETCFINAGSNTLIGLSRRNDTPYGIYRVYSTDGGDTWSAPALTNLAGTGSDVANAEMCLDDDGNIDIVIMDRTDGFLYLSHGNSPASMISNPTGFSRTPIFRKTKASGNYLLGYPSIENLGGTRRLISVCDGPASAGAAEIYFGFGNINE